MKYTKLAQHLHQIRHNKSGRAIGNAMTVSEVWECILASEETSVDEIFVHIHKLARPVDGMFARLFVPKEEGSPGSEEAHIYVDESLEKHWRDFVIIKEMMHCFTPMEKYNASPEAAGQVLAALVQRGGKYTLNVAADEAGILAAAEVILPHATVEALQATGQDSNQIAARHGLHPDIVSEICRLDVMHHRKNGSL